MSDTYFQTDEILGKAFDSKIVRRLAPYLNPYLFRTIFAISLVIAGMVLFLINPYLLGLIVDLGIKQGNADKLTKLSLLYIFIEILVFLTAYLQGYLLQEIGQRVMYDIRSQLFSHLQRMPIRFFDKNPVGRLVTRTTNDVAALAELFSSGLVVVIGDLVLIVGIAISLLLLQPTLGVTTLLTFPLLIAAAYFFQDKIRKTYRNVRVRIA
ncbi:ABC transporter ATP-binding protein, partial [bacterium]|nr:ABC transporter ATP-binding protein [bacterium]